MTFPRTPFEFLEFVTASPFFAVELGLALFDLCRVFCVFALSLLDDFLLSLSGAVTKFAVAMLDNRKT
jgi:hypothetical protein